MKIRLFAVSLTCLTLPLLIACGSKHEEGAPTNSTSKPADPTTLIKAPSPSSVMADEIRYEAHCGESRSPETCLGAYGFTVFNTMDYQVGPGPKGQKFSGRLKKDEFYRLWASANQSLLHSTLQNEMDKERIAAAPSTTDSIQIRSGHHTVSVTRPELLEMIKSLVALYYPPTFPNPCIDANMELSKTHEEATFCKYDSECAYVTPEYLPLDPNDRSVHSVITDDCSFLTPLSVGNFLKLLTIHKDLSQKRELARKTCGDAFKKPSCSEPRSLNPWSSPPRCVESKCRAGISIES